MTRTGSILLPVLLLLLFAIPAGAAAPAGGVPRLDVTAVCRGIAAQATTAGERGGPDLSFSRCMRSEMAMRQKLARKWATFTPEERANCIGAEMGGVASYTDLATCLEMAKDARQLNR